VTQLFRSIRHREDNAFCVLLSKNPTNRERSRHVDVRVHFLRDMVRDGSVKVIKCAGTQNVADAPTKRLPRPAFHKHRKFLKGTARSFSFLTSLLAPTSPLCRPTSRKRAAFLLQSPSQVCRWVMFISIATGGERSRRLGTLGGVSRSLGAV
jgi:hypothetical protein